MTDRSEITELRIIRGMCRGRLIAKGSDAPDIVFEAGDIAMPDTEISRDKEGWQFTQELPAALLSEGAQSVVISDAKSGVELKQFSLSVGEALADDLRAEVAQIRAELDLLKTAFRREMRKLA